MTVRFSLVAAVTVLLYCLSHPVKVVDDSFWERAGALLAAVIGARIAARTICPIAAILFKWIVIGRYRPGTYRM